MPEMAGCEICDQEVPLDRIVHSLGVDNGVGDVDVCRGCLETEPR